ncbi:MAG: hypothetical protein ACI8T1_001246 [Verrucomicrobiales bacterium]|jgi:hypothetical protein
MIRESPTPASRDWNSFIVQENFDELHHCERTIQKGLKSFMEVGHCLMTIRDKRLYRIDYSTFEDYCRDRWGISRPYAYKLMAGAKVVDDLSSEEDISVLPDNANQVRKLTPLSKEDRIAAWKRVLQESTKTGKPITAKLVQTVVTVIHPESVKLAELSNRNGPTINREERREIIQMIGDFDKAIGCGDLSKLAVLAALLRRKLCEDAVTR